MRAHFTPTEPEITTFGSSRIVVKLPGVQDPERAKNLLGTTAQLEFRMVRPAEDITEQLEKLDDAFKGDAVDGQLDTITALVEAVELDQGIHVFRRVQGSG